MSEPAPDQNLHLPSLVIKNFRGIDELTIPRLGRVTLLTGKNGVGKTTVLEAVRIYAARCRARIMSEVLIERDEFVNAIDPLGEEIGTPDWEAFFPGRNAGAPGEIVIGPIGDKSSISMRSVMLDEHEFDGYIETRAGFFTDERLHGLKVSFQDYEYTIPASYVQDPRNPRVRHLVRLVPGRAPDGFRAPEEILCNVSGPTVPDNDTIEQYMNLVALTTDEQLAVDALNLFTQTTVERVAAVGARILTGRRILAKVNGKDLPVPLRSLGDGATRAFAVSLALANSADGFLLIDEAENGIHHSVQAKFWNMVLQTAERNNVQVIATTHSWDCVEGFAQAANELEDIEGLLVRIERVPVGLRAITYDESRLASVTKYDIEVR